MPPALRDYAAEPPKYLEALLLDGKQVRVRDGVLRGLDCDYQHGLKDVAVSQEDGAWMVVPGDTRHPLYEDLLAAGGERKTGAWMEGWVLDLRLALMEGEKLWVLYGFTVNGHVEVLLHFGAVTTD